MRHIYRLNKFLFLFFPFFLYGFNGLYSLQYENFEITSQKGSYKLVLKNQKYLAYQNTNGFKFFIPYFTKEFNLKVLRYNSIGFINGILSMDNKFKHILNTSLTQYKYYITDYKTKDEKQLYYLLKGDSIPYKKVTSISIEMYNIPANISNHLNRYVYFKILPTKQKNKLTHILYSFYIILDKKLVDNYVKKNYPNSKNYIKTFLNHIKNISYYKKKSKVIQKSVKKSVPKNIHKPKLISFRLILTRFLYMKNFGYVITPTKINLDKLQDNIQNIKSNIDEILEQLDKKLDKSVVFKPHSIALKTIEKFDEVKNKMDSLPEMIKLPICKFDKDNIDEDCFKNLDYFQNYITYLIQEDKTLDNKMILTYGDYKVFNDVGKYYFEHSNLEQSEIFLQKAYFLAQDKRVPAHNLAVLYTKKSHFYDAKKAIEFLKQSKMEIDDYNLGIFYYVGLGVKESDIKAREYFQKAINIEYARKNLEIMNKYKIGLPK